MTTQLKQGIERLYQEDFVLWVDETVKQLQQRDVENLDWEHLIEEIEALGSEQRRKVNSFLKQLLIYLLLYQYWESEKEQCQKGWKDEIDNFRDELEELLESKRLYNHFLDQFEAIYFKARRRAISKTELPPQTFPEQCPFTIDQILDFEFFPQ